jgi:hypothetical protein
MREAFVEAEKGALLMPPSTDPIGKIGRSKQPRCFNRRPKPRRSNGRISKNRLPICSCRNSLIEPSIIAPT